jgi:hypothetical protein
MASSPKRRKPPSEAATPRDGKRSRADSNGTEAANQEAESTPRQPRSAEPHAEPAAADPRVAAKAALRAARRIADEEQLIAFLRTNRALLLSLEGALGLPARLGGPHVAALEDLEHDDTISVPWEWVHEALVEHLERVLDSAARLAAARAAEAEAGDEERFLAAYRARMTAAFADDLDQIREVRLSASHSSARLLCVFQRRRVALQSAPRRSHYSLCAACRPRRSQSSSSSCLSRR